MKALLLTAALVTTPVTINAQENPHAHLDCEKVGDTAAAIMGARQYRNDFWALIKLAEGNEILERVIVKAFEVPLMPLNEMKDEEVMTFKSIYAKRCYEVKHGGE